MRKILTIVMLVALLSPCKLIFAQSSSATQQIKVHLEPTINITANANANVHLGFNDFSNYMNGVESGSQLFRVHSNKDFVVNVKTNSPSFSYSGSETPAPSMPVSNTLFLSIAQNNTGGNVANSFSSYKSLSSSPQDLLLNCRNGGNKTFSVSYKANPGTGFPAGDYTVGVVYTATQP